MSRLDHLAIPVRNRAVSQDWYVAILGLEIEFETSAMVSLKDQNGLSLFLGETGSGPSTAGFGFWFQVDDVDAFHAAKSQDGIKFVSPPQKTAWGYGAELRDPDGYVLGFVQSTPTSE